MNSFLFIFENLKNRCSAANNLGSLTDLVIKNRRLSEAEVESVEYGILASDFGFVQSPNTRFG